MLKNPELSNIDFQTVGGQAQLISLHQQKLLFKLQIKIKKDIQLKIVTQLLTNDRKRVSEEDFC